MRKGGEVGTPLRGVLAETHTRVRTSSKQLREAYDHEENVTGGRLQQITPPVVPVGERLPQNCSGPPIKMENPELDAIKVSCPPLNKRTCIYQY